MTTTAYVVIELEHIKEMAKNVNSYLNASCQYKKPLRIHRMHFFPKMNGTKILAFVEYDEE